MARIEFVKCEEQSCPLENIPHGHFVLASGVYLPVSFSSVEGAKKYFLDYLLDEGYITDVEVIELEEQMVKAGLRQKASPSEIVDIMAKIIMTARNGDSRAEQFFEELSSSSS